MAWFQWIYADIKTIHRREVRRMQPREKNHFQLSLFYIRHTWMRKKFYRKCECFMMRLYNGYFTFFPYFHACMHALAFPLCICNNDFSVKLVAHNSLKIDFFVIINFILTLFRFVCVRAERASFWWISSNSYQIDIFATLFFSPVSFQWAVGSVFSSVFIVSCTCVHSFSLNKMRYNCFVVFKFPNSHFWCQITAMND